MNFKELKASDYKYSEHFYKAEFEKILSKMVLCYNLMLKNNVELDNNEIKIRDVLLLSYLKNNHVRKNIGLSDYLFDREVPEDNTTGRTDIKIQTLDTFIDTNAYYIIECKRLDAINQTGITGLNAMYIKNGINRFVSETYSSNYKVNGMLGFIVKKMDIDENVKAINKLLLNEFKDVNTKIPLNLYNFIPDFKYCYSSIHFIPFGEILLYHLMFDFSKNIMANDEKLII